MSNTFLNRLFLINNSTYYLNYLIYKHSLALDAKIVLKMGLIIEREISQPSEVKEDIALNTKTQRRVQQDTQEIKEIISGKDSNRKLLIIGPCSAWPSESVLEYAQKLSQVSKDVSDKLKIVLRCYTQKPRTTIGWTGPMNSPDPFGDEDIERGIRYCRTMMRDVAQNHELPLADEALFTHNGGYFDDLLSYIAIGARSSEDHEHRVYASGLDVPVGMKNPTSGNLEVAINSIIAAQHPHRFKFNRNQVRTTGNEYAHLILRGGSDGPNYQQENLRAAFEKMSKGQIINPAIIIDASHANSRKIPLKQLDVLEEVLTYDPDVLRNVKGFMVESFLEEGNQNHTKYERVSDLVPGLSITDGCIGWDNTQRLMENMYRKL